MRQIQTRIPRPRRPADVKTDLAELRKRRSDTDPVGAAYEVITEQIDDLLGELWALRADHDPL